MARVTVEDCIDKVENRFDLVLLASHRARMISSGSQITVERDNDKNPVVALREIAEATVSPGDLKEDLIHSLQKYVEVDEPEPEVPLIGAGAGASVDSDDTEVTADRMTEEELLKGLEGLAPPEEPPEEKRPGPQRVPAAESRRDLQQVRHPQLGQLPPLGAGQAPVLAGHQRRAASRLARLRPARARARSRWTHARHDAPR